MTIEFEKVGMRADPKDLPGSPVVGIGKIKIEALPSLFRYTLATYDGNKTSIHFNDLKTVCS